MGDTAPGRTERIEVNGGRVWSGGVVQRPTNVGATAADGGAIGAIAVTRPMPAGSYQDDYVASQTYASAKDLKNPFTVDAKFLALGADRYVQACAPCHGTDGGGVGPVTWHDPSKGRDRYIYPAAQLWGEKSVVNTKAMTDGEVYNRIRNGYWVAGADASAAPVMHMPGYAASLTDKERWAVTAFLRDKSPAPAAAAVTTDAAPADATKENK